MPDDASVALLDGIIDLVDRMLSPFDVVELTDELVATSLALTPADSAGILLDDLHGGLQMLAGSSSDARHLELLELQHDEGPCVEAFGHGRLVQITDLSVTTTRWPRFTPAALERGVTAAYAVPMTVQEHRIGALNLFCVDGRLLGAEHLRIAGVLTRMATLAVLNNRSHHEQQELARQLQAALSSRVLIKQAKGVIAERQGIDVDTAFGVLRHAARERRARLSDISADVVAGRLRLDRRGAARRAVGD